jgi:parvulin-like peptidyl-prolyl isomerase
MILDIVGFFVQNPRDRNSRCTRMSRKRFCWWLMWLPLLLVTACSSGGNDKRPAVASEQPGVTSPTVGAATAVAPATDPTSVPAVPSAVVDTPTPSAPLAAVVDGHYIYLADYEREAAQYERALNQMGVDLTTDDGKAQLAEARQEVLQGLIDQVLIDEGATTLGITVTDEDVAAQMSADIEAGGGQAAFDEWLKSTDQTQEDYQNMLRRSIISQRAWDVVAANVPDAVEQVHARVIVLEDQAAADAVVSQLRQGADFATLVREQSVDVATKDSGGDLGWFPRGLVAPELEDAAFALQPGETSDPVSLGGRFHVIQVVERESARALSDEMKTQLMQAKFDRWLADLRAQAVIERFAGN